MSIPFCINQANGTSNPNEPNITTHLHFAKVDENLKDAIIAKIIIIIYQICSQEYGFGINIHSFEDFCEKYWKNTEYGCNISFYKYVFQVYYFANDCWNEFNVIQYQNEIYDAYVYYTSYQSELK
jgi:hypothetical protein